MSREPSDDPRPPRASVGLCGLCANHRLTRNRVGSRFYLCGLSKEDPRYPKYPVLPVVSCEGYVPGDQLPSE
ncbi:MAG TPA: hypothetical protein EYO20_04680 [Gemmatimonadetes bacterium]|nr:hypothetical protein [Gemmatimonadota bacterium]HIB09126.1 hypothetical protein [Gemmatimonadota bacterium]HIC15160.1 hypothetical protein [Gemmatimonadota bacterium]